MLYKKILKPILFLFDPEAIHNLFLYIGEFLGSNALTRSIIGFFYDYRGKEDISRTVDGIYYRTPIVLGAGFDCNARLIDILPHIALGGEEIGSVTARPCAGNEKPRMKRLPQAKSIWVNKGLRNDGVESVIHKIKRYVGKCVKTKFVLGISIARTNDQKSASIEGGIDDYVQSFKRLNEENIGDYYAINISCPNSFGGETFCSSPELLERLLQAIRKVPCKKPIYIKMPINLSWDHFHSLLKVIDNMGLQGVIIGNLNKDFSLVKDDKVQIPTKKGGFSGLPCAQLSTELVRKTRDTYGKRLTIIGSGGIFSAEDAIEKLQAGADLVQLITGLIYEGPGLVKSIAKKLPKR